ncbi:MAG: hypothetical protein ACOCU4_02460 [Alkalispirochaeta sp.]
MAPTVPSTAPGDELRTWAERDRAFDLFDRPQSIRAEAARELAHARPVIVTEERTVVWGFHYLPAWREWPAAEFPVLVYQDGPQSRGLDRTVDALRWALTAEGRAGAYGFSELDRIRRAVEQADAVAASWDEIVPLLTGENDPWPMIQRFRALPPELADAVDTGMIDLRTAEAIPREYAEAVARFFPLVAPLSFSNRRQALRMVTDVVRGGATSEVLREELERVPSRDVIGELRRRRYPTLSELEARFEAIRRETLSGSGVTLAAPSNFEGDRFHLSFNFRTGSELRSRLSAAARLEDNLNELLDLLF